jgi:hypothetical protein
MLYEVVPSLINGCCRLKSLGLSHSEFGRPVIQGRSAQKLYKTPRRKIHRSEAFSRMDFLDVCFVAIISICEGMFLALA